MILYHIIKNTIVIYLYFTKINEVTNKIIFYVRLLDALSGVEVADSKTSSCPVINLYYL